MLQELKDAGVELPGEKDQDLELWDLFKNRGSLRRKREKVMRSRFQAFVHRAEKELPWWSMDLWEREYVGLELGMLDKKALAEKKARLSTFHSRCLFPRQMPNWVSRQGNQGC